jgi:hypothetical protein
MTTPDKKYKDAQKEARQMSLPPDGLDSAKATRRLTCSCFWTSLGATPTIAGTPPTTPTTRLRKSSST